jgi:hypothetical protein
LVSGITILCKHDRSSLLQTASKPTTNGHIGGISTQVAHELEGLLKNYSPMMKESVERAVEKGIKLGAVFAEVGSPIRRPGRN